MTKRIAIGGDHAGVGYKEQLKQHLGTLGYAVEDFGPYTTASVDYPDYVHPLAKGIEAGEFDFGIVICGSGNGIAMTVNKHQKVRAALCWMKEIAALARLHNDANVISIPARYTSVPQAVEMVETFLNTEFEGGRHQNRVNKIACQ